MPVNHVEYLILGAGPAGLQLAYFLEMTQRSYLVLEKGESVGTFFQHFPRHRKLISINKIYTGQANPEINLRWDWNSLISGDQNLRLAKYSQDYFPHTDSLVDYLKDYANECNLNIQLDTEATCIQKELDDFLVIDQNSQQYRAKRLIVATGISKPYVPNIPGIELTDNYATVSIDQKEFINQRVLVIGKGNSGFETADHLVSAASLIHVVSPSSIRMAWRTKYVGHLRAVNNNFLDTYQLKSQNAILDAEIIQIKRINNEFHVSLNYSHAGGEQETLVYDRVITCTGFQFDNSIFDDSCKPLLTIDDRFPAQTSEWESVNIPGLYFAGVLMHMRDFKKKQSGFIHGFRHNIEVLHNFLEYKYHNVPLPSHTIPATPQSITDSIIERVNSSAGLWQQTGFLCDVIVIDRDHQSAKYYKDLARDYVHSGPLGQNEDFYVITLEFGNDVDKVPDPFAMNRIQKDDYEHADDSAFIHPIIRHYHSNRLLEEHHINEDLEADWTQSYHAQPLLSFLEEQMSLQVSGETLVLPATLPQVSIRQDLQSQSDLSKTVVANQDDAFSTPGISKRRIGEYLIDAGLINQAQLQYALLEQQKVDLKVGEIFVRHGWLNQQTINFFIGELCNSPLEQKVIPVGTQ